MKEESNYMEVTVSIPNFDGTGVAKKLLVEVPVRHDPDTGEALMTDEGVEIIEETRRRYLKLLSAAEIRALRKRLGFTQSFLATLLQAGKKNFSRWESGNAQPSRMSNVLLRAVRDGVLPISYLRSLQPGTPDASSTQLARWREKRVPEAGGTRIVGSWQGVSLHVAVSQRKYRQDPSMRRDNLGGRSLYCDRADLASAS